MSTNRLVVELADTPDSRSGAERRVGSSPTEATTRWKCLLCGRDKFTQRSGHRCVGGYRKRRIKWQRIIETKLILLNLCLVILLALTFCSKFSKTENVRYGDPVLFNLYRLHAEYRESKGLTQFEYNEKLAAAAQSHSEWMARNRNMSHTGENRSEPGERITKQGYSWSSCAENIAYGYKTPESVVEGWKQSPGHNANMLGRNTQIRVGYAKDAEGVLYWTTNFATPRKAP